MKSGLPDLSCIRLVISDVDGTLIDQHKRLHPETIAAVERLRAEGIAFTIISARPRSGLMPIIELLDLDEPVGAFNGGLVVCREGNVLRHDTIAADAARGVLAMAADASVNRWVFAGDHWYVTSLAGEHVERERVASNLDPVLVTDLAPLLDRPDKITFVSDDAPMLKGLTDRLVDAYGTEATIAQSHAYYLDVTALSANKGEGVAALAAAIGIPLTQTAVFGDQFNDLPMFRRAAWSAAMAQGPQAVRDEADFVSTSNDEGGVARAIDVLLDAGGAVPS